MTQRKKPEPKSPPQREPERTTSVPEVQQDSTVTLAGPPRPWTVRSPSDVLWLQQTIGNQDVARLLAEQGQQRELTLSSPMDPCERKADEVADQVTRMTGPASVNLAPAAASEHGGEPLPGSLRSYFEPRFGYDFSRVRVHVDSEAARAVRARAYTVGEHIVFNRGEYAPGTAEGQHLLAHELTHVVQQSQGGDSAPRGVIQRQPAETAENIELEASTPEEARDVALPSVSAQSVDPRNHSDFIDQRVTAVGYGIYLGGYLLFCEGLEMPVFLPESHVNFGLTSATSVNLSIYPDRESALNALPVGPPAPGQDMPYAFYRAVGGLIVPTIFSPATAPRTIETISMAVNALASNVEKELAGLALSLVTGALLRLFYNRLVRARQEKPPPKSEKPPPKAEKPPPKGEKPPPKRLGPPSGWPEEVDFGTVQQVLEGQQPPSALMREHRQLAANYYRNMANQVRGSRAADARAFNLERARFLEEGGNIPPGKLNDFMRRR